MDQAIKPPQVTVLMPVYNGQAYLKEAIESILAQTFVDFEFIIIDDGSTDESAAIIASFADPRIISVSNTTNKGLPTTLNRGFELARGEFIARMDCDDISLPTRLEKQVVFMTSHPEVAACGTWIRTIGSGKKYTNKFFVDSENIRAGLLFNTSMAHPSVMLRKADLDRLNLKYDISFKYYEEDYALWIELSKQAKLANIPQVLFYYRIHEKSVSHIHLSDRQAGVSLLRQKQLENLGLHPNTEDMRIHNSLKPQDGESVLNFISKEEAWLMKIVEANKEAEIYSDEALSKVIYKRWKTICGINAKAGLKVWKKFTTSPLYAIHPLDSVKIFIKSLV